ncbi:MAG: RluA family pseudouridine synthase [Roseburia sp.]|nr:RluA family pseudouridine synthase [Roseburia sp.]
MKKFTVKENTTLKEFTDATYPQGSFAYGALIKKGDIRVNGIKTRENITLSAGDEVVYYTTPAQEAKSSHKVVYEDENVLIADKPAGVSSEALFCELEDSGCLPVHRLDRNTCGLIALAKNAEAQAELLSAFKNRDVEKIYLCFAKNAFKNGQAVLTAYASKNAEAGRVKVYDIPAEGRVKMITEYAVLKTCGDYALVKVTLHTGKTHQIRAHLAHIGCPVLGDGKYGDFALNKKYGASRQILVARTLKFNLSGSLSYLNAAPFTSGFYPSLPR